MTDPAPPSGTNRYLQRVLEAHRLGDFNFNIQDNALNNLETHTYFITIHLVSDTDARKPDIGNLVYTNQVPTFILARSGVTTGLNITELEIRDAVSSSFRNRNNATTEINFTIVEPYGMTMVDKMYNASQTLGVQNWRMAPLILTLEIRGRNPDGTPHSNTQVQKFYSMVITDMDGTLVSTGTTYKIRAVVQNTLGFTDQYYMLPSNLTLRVGAGGIAPGTIVTTTPTAGNAPASAPVAPQVLDGTVGQFFQVIGQLMSDFYVRTRLDSPELATTPVVLYEFTVDEQLAAQMINMSAFSNRRRQAFNGTSDTQEIHVNRLGVSELVDDILSSITDPEFFTANAQVGTIRIPRIECAVEYVGWDNLMNDYIKKFTFSIGILETIRAIPTVAHGEYFQLTPQNARTRLEGMRNIIRKAYPYLYTGMNTEVLNLELTFNNLHIIPLPMHNGRTITPAQEGQSLAIRTQELQRQYRVASAAADRTQADAILPQLQALGSTPTTTNLPPDVLNVLAARSFALQDETGMSQADPIQAVVSDLTATQDAARAARERLLDIRASSLVVFDPESVPTMLRDRATRSPEAVARARQIAQARTASPVTARPRNPFVEDVSVNIREPGRLSYAASPRDIANNLARPSNIQDATQGDVRGIYSTILAQMYDRPGLQLTEIDMEIRGDPYWLGESNLERVNQITEYVRTRGVAAVGAAASSLPPASGIPASFARSAGLDTGILYADYYTKDAAFLLLFRAGNTPSETTGYMNFDTGSRENQSVFFNGVYIALEVTHVFAQGKFTQRIRAVRDALTNLDVVAQAPAVAPSDAGATGAATPVAAAPNPVQAANNGGAIATQVLDAATTGGPPAAPSSPGIPTPVVTNTSVPIAPSSSAPVTRGFVTPLPRPGESATQFGIRSRAEIEQQRRGGSSSPLPLTEPE
jgi:hypothetical protein